jgi:hypothetical protein
MVNSLLDDVNELLRLSCGDENRLEDIKRRLEDGLTIYNSDINYLKKLVEQQKDEIQENAESKNNEPEPEPEPYEQYQPEPEHEPKSNPKPKKKSSKKTKPLTIFLILAMLVSLAILGYAIGNYTNESSLIGIVTEPTVIVEKQPEVTAPKVKSFSQMTDSKLSAMAVDWNYKDLLRNIDYYSGKIIFVDGTVTKIHRDFNSINLCINAGNYSCDDFMFVNVDENKWLEDDKLSGFVEVKRLEETGTANKFADGEWVGSGNYVPRVSEIRLTCSNC